VSRRRRRLGSGCGGRGGSGVVLRGRRGVGRAGFGRGPRARLGGLAVAATRQGGARAGFGRGPSSRAWVASPRRQRSRAAAVRASAEGVTPAPGVGIRGRGGGGRASLQAFFYRMLGKLFDLMFLKPIRASALSFQFEISIRFSAE